MPDLRPFRWSDLDAYVALFNSSESVEHTGWSKTLETARHWLELPGVEPEKHIWVLPEGDRLIGVVGAVPVAHFMAGVLSTFFRVDPDHRGGPLEPGLLEFIGERMRERYGAADPPFAMDAFLQSDHTRVIRLYEKAGYAPVRWFLELVCDLDRRLEAIASAEEVRICPVVPDRDAEALHKVLSEAFQDHWMPPESSIEQTEHMMRSPNFDPDLTLIAWDSDREPAGACVNAIRRQHNEQYGTREGVVQELGVRRPYRCHGLGKALLIESLRRLHAVGMDTATLTVDAANPTGATHLYDSVGFRERKRGVVYRRLVMSDE